MDDALVQDDGIDLIVEELDRRWEVTQDQDKASKIEKAFFETQKGRQNGDDLHVPRGAEETQFATAGKFAGKVTTSGDQEVTRHYETRNSPNAATTRW